MADYELVAGTVWQFATSVSCQRNFAHNVLKHPPRAESSDGGGAGHGSESERPGKKWKMESFYFERLQCETDGVQFSVKESSLRKRQMH